MTVSIWQADDTQPVRDVDVLVVGAGLVGCGAAYFAAREHGREVVITEMRDLGLGTSSRNAGFMITGLDAYYHQSVARYGLAVTREMWGISQTAHRHWHHFIEGSGGQVRLNRCGSMLLAESADEALDLEEAARMLDAEGFEFEFIPGDPLGRGYYAALRQPVDCAVHPLELARAVFAQSGAELIPNNELYRIENGEDDTVRVYTRQFIFRARYVLLCTNAFSTSIDPYFIGKVIPTRAQCLVTAPLKTGPVLGTIGYSDYGYMYYRDTFDGRLLIGGGRKQNKILENDTTDDRVTDPVQRHLDHYLRTRFPEIDAPVERRWAGIMGFSADGLPLVGTLPGRPRVGFAVAFHGHGLAMGAAVAERAVDHLLKGTHPGAVYAGRMD
ncbi:MAG TPA: FAD-dependent oxidoreductase [Aggregatilineales bacterium]|nr:FAD-dependent oxidoreductase [Aggregatilineales bacterium]